MASAVALGVPLTVRMPAASGGTLPTDGKDNGDELLLLVDDAVDSGDGGDGACMVANAKSAWRPYKIGRNKNIFSRMPWKLFMTLIDLRRSQLCVKRL